MNLKKILTGKRQYKVISNNDWPIVKQKLYLKQQQSNWLEYGLNVNYCENDQFIITYKFGRGLSTIIKGRSEFGKLYLECGPGKVITTLIIVSILAFLTFGIYHLCTDQDKTLSLAIFLMTLLMYISFVVGIQFIHDLSVFRLIKLIDGRVIK